MPGRNVLKFSFSVHGLGGGLKHWMRRWIPPLKTAPSCVKAVSVLMAIPKRGFPRAGLIRAGVRATVSRLRAPTSRLNRG